MAATMPLGSAPSFSIASTADSRMPDSAPFHPACPAPITRAFGSTNKLGPVGGGDAHGETLNASHDGVGARPRRVLRRSGGHHGIGRMDLVRAEKMLRGNAHLRRHPATVLRDIGRIVLRAEATIEAGVDAIRHAALARKKGVTQAGNGREQW